MSNLSELIRRVEAATGPDRELDAAIWATLQGVRLISFGVSPGGHEQIAYDGALRWPKWIGQPPVTASLDSALSLVERCLPGRNWLIGRGRLRATEPLYGAQIMDGQAVIGEGESEHTPALALCRAMLKALEAD